MGVVHAWLLSEHVLGARPHRSNTSALHSFSGPNNIPSDGSATVSLLSAYPPMGARDDPASGRRGLRGRDHACAGARLSTSAGCGGRFLLCLFPSLFRGLKRPLLPCGQVGPAVASCSLWDRRQLLENLLGDMSQRVTAFGGRPAIRPLCHAPFGGCLGRGRAVLSVLGFRKAPQKGRSRPLGGRRAGEPSSWVTLQRASFRASEHSLSPQLLCEWARRSWGCQSGQGRQCSHDGAPAGPPNDPPAAWGLPAKEQAWGARL